MEKSWASTENKTRRVITLCILYFAQGLLQFCKCCFRGLFGRKWNRSQGYRNSIRHCSIALDIRRIWGPVVDAVFIKRFGPRRQWVLFAQTGMAVSLGGLLVIDSTIGDLNTEVQLVTRVLFIHNIFASLQDVATDALAVEILQPDEVAKVNGSCLLQRDLELLSGVH